jgi:hypothetical protein
MSSASSAVAAARLELEIEGKLCLEDVAVVTQGVVRRKGEADRVRKVLARKEKKEDDVFSQKLEQSMMQMGGEGFGNGGEGGKGAGEQRLVGSSSKGDADMCEQCFERRSSHAAWCTARDSGKAVMAVAEAGEEGNEEEEEEDEEEEAAGLVDEEENSARTEMVTRIVKQKMELSVTGRRLQGSAGGRELLAEGGSGKDEDNEDDEEDDEEDEDESEDEDEDEEESEDDDEDEEESEDDDEDEDDDDFGNLYAEGAISEGFGADDSDDGPAISVPSAGDADGVVIALWMSFPGGGEKKGEKKGVEGGGEKKGEKKGAEGGGEKKGEKKGAEGLSRRRWNQLEHEIEGSEERAREATTETEEGPVCERCFELVTRHAAWCTAQGGEALVKSGAKVDDGDDGDDDGGDDGDGDDGDDGRRGSALIRGVLHTAVLAVDFLHQNGSGNVSGSGSGRVHFRSGLAPASPHFVSIEQASAQGALDEMERLVAQEEAEKGKAEEAAVATAVGECDYAAFFERGVSAMQVRQCASHVGLEWRVSYFIPTQSMASVQGEANDEPVAASSKPVIMANHLSAPAASVESAPASPAPASSASPVLLELGVLRLGRHHPLDQPLEPLKHNPDTPAEAAKNEAGEGADGEEGEGRQGGGGVGGGWGGGRGRVFPPKGHWE